MNAFFQRARNPVTAIGLLAIVLVSALAAPAEELTENQLKAAFLFNFAKFVDWPEASFTAADAPLVMGVVGDEEFARILGETVQGKNVSGRILVVKPVHGPAEVKGCHLLFLPRWASHPAAESLAQARQLSILTVGNSEQFVLSGGMIGFFVQDARVHFAINPDAVQRANLRVSSKLLSLAKVVNPPAPGAGADGMGFAGKPGTGGTK